ncbi:MAG: hypothetical protein JSS86_19715, partial [Cyanobacteria bacterium SZAS LIN-2]|nr:hypothetical protein [Cyanobacteria bacterium SZAS LIN-2]
LSLDGFINEDRAFAIHQYFKYVLLCFKTDAQTETFTTRFGLVAGLSRMLGGDAQSAGLTCSLSAVEQLGGQSRAILELNSQVDMERLCRLYGSHGNFKNFLDARGVSLRREFDMTLDRRRFLRKLRVQQKGEYLPLYEGRMIAQFEAKKESAAPRYFVSREDFRRRVPENCIRVGFVSVSSALNTRSMIAALLPDLPAGNSLPTVVFRSGEQDEAGLNSARSLALYTVAIFNSFVFDWILRLRLSGNNLSYHVLEDLPFPEPGSLEPALFALCVHLSGRLSLEAPDPVSRLRLRVWLEMLVMHIYGIDPDFAGHILRDCRLPTDQLARRRRLSRLNSNQPEPRGFFRVDKELEPDYRLTNLVLSAYGQLHTSSGEFGRLLEQLEPTSPVLLPAAVEAALERRCAGALL